MPMSSILWGTCFEDDQDGDPYATQRYFDLSQLRRANVCLPNAELIKNSSIRSGSVENANAA
jgi:hypothetical protein